MATITKLIKGRLTDSQEVNSEIITDLSQKKGDRIVVKAIYSDGYQYLIVYNCLPLTAFEIKKEIVTSISHYEKFPREGKNIDDLKWNSVDVENIDKNIFPNRQNLITDNDTTVNIGTEEEPNIIGKYDYFRYSALGRSMEKLCFDDIEDRLIKAGLYIKP